MSKARSQSANRAERIIKGRQFSNKKGIQMVVTKYYDSTRKAIRFSKTKKVLQRLKGKTIVHHQIAY